MILTVDSTLPLPAYEQMREQIVRMIVSGTLPVGTRLPTIRQLAADLGLAKGTVARAYELLEAESVVETRGRHGTYVAEVAASTRTSRRDDLDAVATAAVITARQLGAGVDELVRAVHHAWDRL